MEEVEVIKRTFDYLLEESKYQLWIDNPPAYNELSSKEYPRHNITIKGFIPDLIGFNEFEDIVIEARGTVSFVDLLKKKREVIFLSIFLVLFLTFFLFDMLFDFLSYFFLNLF